MFFSLPVRCCFFSLREILCKSSLQDKQIGVPRFIYITESFIVLKNNIISFDLKSILREVELLLISSQDRGMGELTDSNENKSYIFFTWDKEGNIVSNKEKVLQRWSECYEKHFELQNGMDSDNGEEWIMCVQTAQPYVEPPMM
jgi:hypothetical protein